MLGCSVQAETQYLVCVDTIRKKKKKKKKKNDFPNTKIIYSKDELTYL